MRGALLSGAALVSLWTDTVQLPNFKDDTGGIRPAGVPHHLHPPAFVGLSQFDRNILTFQEQSEAVFGPKALCIRKELYQGGAGARRDDVETFGHCIFDSGL